jgi:hypothetical protein
MHSICWQISDISYLRPFGDPLRKEISLYFYVPHATCLVYLVLSLLPPSYGKMDCFCSPVFRLPGCRIRGPGFDSRLCQIFCVAVGLERGPLSLLRINEELLERKVADPV